MESLTQPDTDVGRSGRAVVLGASMAGLLAARALSESFAEVIVIDRDDLAGSGPRKGVPQGQHAHGILARGRKVFEELFPGLTADLSAAGAAALDLHGEVAWFNGIQPISAAPSDLLAVCLSRPALEDYVRGRVRLLPGVELRGGCEASGLLTTADRQAITGVQLVSLADQARSELTADLVVDATGRGNRSTTWLTQLGYRSPREDTVKASVSYASREYQRGRPLPSGMAAAVSSLSPSEPYGMVLIPIEGDRWMLTLIGVGKEVPPVDPAGFDQFARHLPLADLQDVIDHAQPLTEPKRFRIPASIRRRYELLKHLPEGYVVIGDALCAFNPVYAQGMSVAAIEAQVLRDCIRQSLDGLPRRFYRQVARVLDVPWQMAAGGDLAVPTTVGKRTLKIRIMNAYIAKVLRAAETDTQVSLAFHEAANLISRPERLLAPRMLARVLLYRPGQAVRIDSEPRQRETAGTGARG